jgi:hypothetical protein
MRREFAEKQWTKPRTPGVTPFPADYFKTEREFALWVMEHEYQHSLVPPPPKTVPPEEYARFEDSINRAASRGRGMPEVRKEAAVPAQAPAAPAPSVQFAGINIWSGSKDRLGAALTNMTVRANEKGTLDRQYTVTFDNVIYRDAEQAYQKLKKVGAPVAENLPLMTQIITAKLQQHPQLVSDIDARGGEPWLLASQHTVPTATRHDWEGVGIKSPFMRALIDAYRTVKQAAPTARLPRRPPRLLQSKAPWQKPGSLTVCRLTGLSKTRTRSLLETSGRRKTWRGWRSGR